MSRPERPVSTRARTEPQQQPTTEQQAQTLCHLCPQVFCGNFEYDAPERAILDLFEKYGSVHRIDMKTGEPPELVMAVRWHRAPG